MDSNIFGQVDGIHIIFIFWARKNNFCFVNFQSNFNSNTQKYRTIINNATEADKVVRDKFESHKMYIDLLSQGMCTRTVNLCSSVQLNTALFGVRVQRTNSKFGLRFGRTFNFNSRSCVLFEYKMYFDQSMQALYYECTMS